MIKQILCILLCCVNLHVYGGVPCDGGAFDPETFVIAGDKALLIEKTLLKENPRVALIARVGSDLSQYNLHYSHIAFLIKDTSLQQWNVIHLLNHCNTATSSIYNQGLMNFFLDDVYNYDSRLVIPSPLLQNRLFALLHSQKKLSLHENQYSLIAYPFSTQYQNSNQWVLELIASALTGANTRTQIQSWLRKEHYSPTQISIPKIKLLGAKLFKKNIRIDDHPKQERHTNHYTLVSAESVFNFLAQGHEIIFDKEFRTN